ncbi:hypothetical protein F8388_011089 [Cannabis sativa]|uniref:Uncharacterized protein n=1 Tax=Cannabis sativa TaxID=3483 RepID=A0A7J6F5I8_CANSA|nr:hypothetical protein F8388_011089 [Cannabis sativa]KAF4388603.1 hypothetical protein G4B88_021514 [Cannabis sativa]
MDQSHQVSANLPTDHTPIKKHNAEKKKRPCKIIGGGLRQFSTIVCKKLEAKGRATYGEIADEIIAEFGGAVKESPVSLDEFDEKNIRRRVYDALNVLMALDIITRDKKEIQWKGLPSQDVKALEELKATRMKLVNRIGKKTAYLNDLKDQVEGFQHLISRNKQLLNRESSPLEAFSLPFLLVQTSSHATVEIEISEDMQLVHFDFNSTPFSLHDDAYILKLLRRHQLPAESRDISSSSSAVSSSSSALACGGTKPFYWNSEAHTQR